MRRVVQVCGALVSATALLIGCESLWVGYKTPNPDSCEAPGVGCPSDQICNPQTRKCEPLSTTLLDLSVNGGGGDGGGVDGGGGDGGVNPGGCVGPVSFSCTSGQGMFCTQTPLLTGILKRIHGTSDSDLWAISSNRIARYNGTYWNPITSCAASTGFVDVFSVSPSEIWFIESRRVYRLLSQTISEIPITLPTGAQLRAIRGASGKIFVVGTNGVAMKWDGTKWTDISPGVTTALNSVWGPDEQNIWVVGDAGTVRYSNGTSWTSINTGVTSNLQSVFGSSTSTVVAAGSGGTLLSLTAASSTIVTSGTANTLSAGSLAGDGSGFVVGTNIVLRRTAGPGGTYSIYAPTDKISQRPNHDVRTLSTTSSWAVGGSTGAVRSKWNGTLWFDSFDEILPVVRALAVSTLTSPNTVYALGVGIDGKTYAVTTDLQATTKAVALGTAGFVGNALWVDPAPTGTILALAVGSGGGAYTYANGLWTPTSTFITDNLLSICGTDSKAVWAVGADAANQNGRVINWNGISWATVTGMSLTGNPLRAVGCGLGQAFAVGNNMVLQTCTNSSCSANTNSALAALAGETGYAVWTTPSSGTGLDIWVAGTKGNVYRYQTSTDKPTQYPSGTTQTLRYIFGKNHSDFYVMGDGGIVLKWNGSAFALVKTDSTASLQAGTLISSGNSAIVGGPSAGWLHQIQ